MWLINTDTRLLEEFYDDEIPKYAILSHTWQEKGEVSFQQWQSGDYQELPGFTKIDRCCQIAKDMGYDYVWVDTCCIDKSSSAELQEAINSMFKWYEASEVCLVYFADVIAGEDHKLPESKFRKSRWFTRGWTLQELLAPMKLLLFDKDWIPFGQVGISWKVPEFRVPYFERIISSITGIPDTTFGESHLDGGNSSIAQKMSWAANRTTKRSEDMAYCLLGIFDINMPLLYGEGGKRAFARLQEEIIKMSDDESIFAWHFESIPNCSVFLGFTQPGLWKRGFS
ncbi:heterokaryon incompatibility protein-domain-containing protein [Bombardia bombarda]|uniref:Heterokaryon incompatibility protein-domain-containing protein n=1 Tax=Bombardia bombarda TaxID=252184 RepID=A0AA39TG84_9PEZI|nr:heterokaryon incompatibility protein-domain-containing protein [Bombardia bombarda]